MLFCRHYFGPLNTFMRKGKEPDPDPDPHLWLLDPDPDSGGPKTCGSCGSGSPTLLWRSSPWCTPPRFFMPYLFSFLKGLSLYCIGAGPTVRHLVAGREEPGGEGGAHGHCRGHHQVRACPCRCRCRCTTSCRWTTRTWWWGWSPWSLWVTSPGQSTGALFDLWGTDII